MIDPNEHDDHDDHGKRRGDHIGPDGEPRSREDLLEEAVGNYRELLTRGSRNFRAYRRRAYLAFIGLALTNALAIYLAVENGDQAREDLAAAIATQQTALADAGAETSERACDADNVLRDRLVIFITDLDPDLEERARSSFPRRNCSLAARPLEREAERGRGG